MNIVYIHGLNSDANSTKGVLLDSYCRQYYPNIKILRPDLNRSPVQVYEQLVNLVTKSNEESKTVLVGSSLGGYFSTLVSNSTGCPVLLLNPSIQPHITLQRFSKQPILDKAVLSEAILSEAILSEAILSEAILSEAILNDMAEDKVLCKQVIHTTKGGWAITRADLQWFAEHQLREVTYPEKVAVFIKEGDELLNPNLSASFYQQQDAAVILQAGGDHRFSDFSHQLPMLIDILLQLQ